MKSSLDLDSFLPYRLNRLAAEMSRRLHAIYGDRFGIDIPEWRVLATLGAREPVTAQEIARDTATHKSTVSRAVARLEQLGWLERVRDDADRRAQVLRLTRSGRQAHDEIIPLVREVEARILSRLDGQAPGVLSALDALEQALAQDG